MDHTNEFIQLCADAKKRVSELTADQAQEHIDDDNWLIIDVREVDEFERGALPGAKHLSKGWIEAKSHTLIHDKSQHVLLYCGGGNRSLLAADNLMKMGYKNIHSLAGGYKGWCAEDHLTIIPHEDHDLEEHEE